MVVADMEALLLEIDEHVGKGTRRYQLHKASACGLYFIREDGDNQYFSFRGENCVKELLKKVEELQVRYIKDYYRPRKFFTKDKDGNLVETDSYYLANRFLNGEEDAKGWDAYYDDNITECYL